MLNILYKSFCRHCDTREKKVEPIRVPFIPIAIICLYCGKKLTGRRRVSKADGKLMVWIEYR